MSPTLWLDAGDRFVYSHSNPRPSGIQRVALEMCPALQPLDQSDETLAAEHHMSMVLAGA